MAFSIQEAATKFEISTHTLRFYDKEGLLPFIQRDQIGNRAFTEEDLNWLAMIICLKNTGMKLKEIKNYADYCTQGMESVEARRQMLTAHRRTVMSRIAEWEGHLNKIDRKIAIYADPELARKQHEALETKR